MKYNVDYHNQSSETVDTQSFWQWKKDYLNSMDVLAWCEWGLRLNKMHGKAGGSNPKVIRKNENS